MASSDDLIPAAAVPAAVLALAQTKDRADVARASYRRLWAGMSNGTIRAERVGSRWFVLRSELPAVAAALGLTLPAKAKSSRAKRASSPSNVDAAAA